MPMAMDDTEHEQQMLVQWCMAAQVFTESEFRQVIQRTYNTEEEEMEEIQPVVEQINSSMGAFSLELRSCMDQTTGTRKWALVNTNTDAISTGATPYSASELVTLKTLVVGVFTEKMGNYSLSLHDALRIATKRNGTVAGTLTRAETESLIRKFCADGWLATDSDNGYVVLGDRSIIELQSFFNVGFADYIRLCSLCKEMATLGIVCMECMEAVHPYCANRLMSASAGQLSCPACNKHIPQLNKFGPGERGVPHALESVAGSVRGESVAASVRGESVGVEEPATQSIKKLRIEDSSDEE
ncbi:hypothetical protein GGI13_001301 [Coemansia sp. RSA 455]|nr:hypothetical protein GGI13_001301 [Coemansia sp. RSA 455]